MAEFNHNGRTYYNPVEFAMARIGGTWKIPIIWRLKDKTMRFSELKRSINHISDKMLTTQLRALESDGFIHREVYPTVPPRVEYSMTEKGKTSIPIIEAIRNYGLYLIDEAGIEHE